MKKLATLIIFVFILTAVIQVFPADSIDLGNIFKSLKTSTINSSKCSNGSCSTPTDCSGGNCAASSSGGDLFSQIFSGLSGGSGGSSGGLSGIFSGIKDFFSNLFSGIKNSLSGLFGGSSSGGTTSSGATNAGSTGTVSGSSDITGASDETITPPAGNVKGSAAAQAIVKEAHNQLGTTRYRTATLDYGNLACAAFVSGVLKNSGTITGNGSINTVGLRTVVTKQGWKKVSLSSIQPGDVIFWGPYPGGKHGHVGVIDQKQGGTWYQIDNSSSKKMPVRRPLNTKRPIVGVYRAPGA